MKKVILSVVALVMAIGTLSAQSVDQIVGKYLDAMGGATKLHEVRSLAMETAIKMAGLEIENLTTIQVGKAMRSDSKIMGNSMVQAYDGSTAWGITPVFMGGNGEAQVMSSETSQSLISQIDPFPLLDYDKKGARVELLTNEKVKDKDAYHLKIVTRDGAESEIWIDAATGLPSKLKTVQNGQELEISFSHYAKIDGISFAMSMEMSNPMAGLMTFDTKSVKVNTTIDESIFTMPVAKN